MLELSTDGQLCTLHDLFFFQHFINLNYLMVFNNFNFEFLLFQRLGVLHLFTCFIYYCKIFDHVYSQIRCSVASNTAMLHITGSKL